MAMMHDSSTGTATKSESSSKKVGFAAAGGAGGAALGLTSFIEVTQAAIEQRRQVSAVTIQEEEEEEEQPLELKRIVRREDRIVGRGYVNMKNIIMELKKEDFDHAGVMIEPESRKFNFTRDTQKSLELSLGFQASNNDKEASKGAMGVYFNSQSPQTVFVSAFVGFSAFALPLAFKRTGIIMGVVTIFLYTFLVIFLCNRLAELPQLVERNFENFTSVSVLFQKGRWMMLTAFIFIFCWVALVTFYITQAEITTTALIWQLRGASGDSPNRLSGQGGDSMEILVVKIAITLLCSWLLQFLTDMKTIDKFAKVGLWAILVAILVTIVSSLLFRFDQIQQGQDTCVTVEGQRCWELWWSNNWELMGGMTDMIVCYGQTGILPYVIAEMNKPEKVSKVVFSSTIQISALYAALGIFGYVGWASRLSSAKALTSSPVLLMLTVGEDVDTIRWAQRWIRYGGILASACLMVKAVCTIPLFLWPLFREVEVQLATQRTPDLEIQLEWARKSQIRLWKNIRRAMLFVMVGYALVLAKYARRFQRWLGIIPIMVAGFVLPALFSVLCLMKHWSLQELRENRKDKLRRMDAYIMKASKAEFRFIPSQREYVGGRFTTHLTVTALIASIVAFGFGAKMVHDFCPPDYCIRPNLTANVTALASIEL